MESYHHHPETHAAANINGGGAALESPNETPTLPSYMVRLERLLGRRWNEDDLIRTIACVTLITDRLLSLEDVFETEFLRLRGETQQPEQLAVALLGYYRLFLAAWSVATQVHSVPVPVMETEHDFNSRDLAAYLDYLETEEAMQEEMEAARQEETQILEIFNSSMDVETERRPYEEIVLEQLETRNFDQEETHEDEEEICSVCLQDLYRGTVAALNCRHEFHVDCITRWLVGGRNCCPLCRATAIRH